MGCAGEAVPGVLVGGAVRGDSKSPGELLENSTAVARTAALLDYTLIEKVDEGLSGKNITGRPGLVEALAMLDRGEADVLMATALDRMSRNVQDVSRLIVGGRYPQRTRDPDCPRHARDYE